MALEAATAVILLAVVAVALVALNRGLQRLDRPDKGDQRIAGCCGMALPEELLRSDVDVADVAGAARDDADQPAAIGPARDTGATPGRASPITARAPSGSREEYHEI